MMRLLNALLITLSSADALRLPTRLDPHKVARLSIQRRDVDFQLAPSHDRARFRRRMEHAVDVQLDNKVSMYFANVTLGIPPQDVQLQLDTGSSDLWVNVPDSALCRQTQCVGGTYNADHSLTHKAVNTKFNITYLDGSGAQGDYVTDTLGFADLTLPTFQFAIGQASTSGRGILGVGYASKESQVYQAHQAPYPNLPQALKAAGHIASTVYSLWLNDLDASTGEILFGAIDSAKYTGNLLTIPLLSDEGIYRRFIIPMTGLSVNGQKINSSELPVGVLLDSGSTLTYLPATVARAVFTKVGAVWDPTTGAAYASCNLANNNSIGSLEFDFSGQTIKVPYDELLLPSAPLGNGQKRKLDNGELACAFGVAETDGLSVLGDTFLRSAYVVYDLENNAVSIAQTVFNTTASNVQVVSKSGGSIPGATAVERWWQ